MVRLRPPLRRRIVLLIGSLALLALAVAALASGALAIGLVGVVLCGGVRVAGRGAPAFPPLVPDGGRRARLPRA